jgi:hypothetical protein
MATLSFAVVLLYKDCEPKATFCAPVVLVCKAFHPIAALLDAVVLESSVALS